MKYIARRFLAKYIFNDALSLESRIINLVLSFGVFGESIVAIVRVIERGSSITVLAVLGMMLITVTAFWAYNRFNIHKKGIWIIAFLIFNILFLVTFFANGGAKSDMSGYFVLCFVLIFFAFRGKECLIMCLIHIAVMLGCYLTDKYYPHLIINFANDFSIYIVIIHTILIPGLLSGLLIRFQTRIYEIEKEKAETASRAKADFLAKISHELRTPLNAIIGLGEVELNKKTTGILHGDEGTRKNLERIHNSGIILLSIINDLLDISKIESGRFEFVPVEYETASFINDTANLNMVRIAGKPIEFQMEIDENLPVKMLGDELRVRQILNNLLSNAFKYTYEGTVRLRIHAEMPAEIPEKKAEPESAKQNPNGQPEKPIKREQFILACSVEDTGIGIKEKDLARVFELYEQADAKSNHHIEGTGLGLSICKNMTDLMGGTISAESDYGIGSVFKVRIPQVIADPRPIGRELAKNLEAFRYNDKKRERRENMRTPMPYGKVLVVDDVSINLEVAKSMLLPYGLHIDCVSSGKKAVQLIREQKIIYDAVFMDHMMPEIDGIETLRIIRNEIDSDYARTIPVIALTANAIIGNDKMFIEHGFQDYLSKPIDTSKLDAILNKWVRNTAKEKSRDWTASATQTDSEENPPEVQNQEPAEDTELSPIAGIDFSGGLKRMKNQKEMYLRILKSYAASMPAMLDKIRQVRMDTIENYRITIHGIKGASYSINADEIGGKAQVLETAAKNNDLETIRMDNAKFILQAEKLVADINEYLENTTA